MKRHERWSGAGVVVGVAAAIGALQLGCDPGGDPNVARNGVAIGDVDIDDDELAVEEEEDTGSAVPERESLVSEQPDDSESPDADAPIVAEQDPQFTGSPSCSVNHFAPDSLGCAYERVTTTSSALVRADCDDVGGGGYRVVHGGCYTNSSATLKYSAPDEGSQGNLPSDDDPWDTTNADGWSCGYTAAPGASQSHIAVALCCPDNDLSVATCV